MDLLRKKLDYIADAIEEEADAVEHRDIEIELRVIISKLSRIKNLINEKRKAEILKLLNGNDVKDANETTNEEIQDSQRPQ